MSVDNKKSWLSLSRKIEPTTDLKDQNPQWVQEGLRCFIKGQMKKQKLILVRKKQSNLNFQRSIPRITPQQLPRCEQSILVLVSLFLFSRENSIKYLRKQLLFTVLDFLLKRCKIEVLSKLLLCTETRKRGQQRNSLVCFGPFKLIKLT